MKVTKIRHAWPEKCGFSVEREQGCEEYVLLHFWQPMMLWYNGNIIETKPYAFIVYDIGEYQHFYSEKHDIVHDWIHITGDVRQTLERYGLKLNTLYYPGNNTQISQMVYEMETEFASENDFCQECIDCKLRELFISISRQHDSVNTPVKIDSNTERTFRDLRLHVFMSLEQNWNNAEMAKKINLSEARFYVVYKAIFGISPNVDLINAKVQRGKNLLAERKYSVSQIAAMCGYSNEYHFIRQFKQKTGITPGKYR